MALIVTSRTPVTQVIAQLPITLPTAIAFQAAMDFGSEGRRASLNGYTEPFYWHQSG